MLHRPKAVSSLPCFSSRRGADEVQQSSARNRGSISSRLASTLQRAETQNTTSSRLRSNSTISGDADEEHTIEHPVEPRATTAMLPPVMVLITPIRALVLLAANYSQSKVVDPDPLCWLRFTEDTIMTSCKSGKSLYLSLIFSKANTNSVRIGHIRTWDRPKDVVTERKSN
jgi:hypothetical protein